MEIATGASALATTVMGRKPVVGAAICRPLGLLLFDGLQREADSLPYIFVSLGFSRLLLLAFEHLIVQAGKRIPASTTAITGYTPTKYVLLPAKNLLEESELTISDIIYRVGIDNHTTFSKLFKKHYSLPQSLSGKFP